MEPLVENNEKKQNVIKLMLLEVGTLLKNMLNAEPDAETVEEAVKQTIEENPQNRKELEKFMPINEISQKVLDQKAKTQFDTSHTFGTELDRKDEDGYNKIEDKVTNLVKAEVSEEKAMENSAKAREKGGRQRTRVDED